MTRGRRARRGQRPQQLQSTREQRVARATHESDVAFNQGVGLRLRQSIDGVSAEDRRSAATLLHHCRGRGLDSINVLFASGESTNSNSLNTRSASLTLATLAATAHYPRRTGCQFSLVWSTGAMVSQSWQKQQTRNGVKIHGFRQHLQDATV